MKELTLRSFFTITLRSIIITFFVSFWQQDSRCWPRKWYFSLRISYLMWTNAQKTVDLFSFTVVDLNEKLYVLRSNAATYTRPLHSAILGVH